jgi:hypothetical protein
VSSTNKITKAAINVSTATRVGASTAAV